MWKNNKAMRKKFNPKILILSIAFKPNIGGLETHLTDLTNEIKKNYQVLTVTLPPISTRVSSKTIERDGNLLIWRIPWFGKDLFYKFLKWPIIEFFYLIPPLFVGLLIALIKYPSIQVIHAQGFSGGLSSVFLGKIFAKRVLISTAYIFHFKNDLVGKVAKRVFSSADRVLCVSRASTQEMEQLGIPEEKLGKCAYWIDLNIFKPSNKIKSKRKLGWPSNFSILFIGRLVEEKGVRYLLNALPLLPNDLILYIIGDGVLTEVIEGAEKKYSNLRFLGRIDNSLTPLYYNAADVVVVPSFEETLGRVNMESLACATPVVAVTSSGAKEVINSQVGILTKLNSNEIAQAIMRLYKNRFFYKRLQSKARLHILKNYSNNNFKIFLKEYDIN